MADALKIAKEVEGQILELLPCYNLLIEGKRLKEVRPQNPIATHRGSVP
jgi:hypothetical protein